MEQEYVLAGNSQSETVEKINFSLSFKHVKTIAFAVAIAFVIYMIYKSINSMDEKSETKNSDQPLKIEEYS